MVCVLRAKAPCSPQRRMSVAELVEEVGLEVRNMVARFKKEDRELDLSVSVSEWGVCAWTAGKSAASSRWFGEKTSTCLHAERKSGRAVGVQDEGRGSHTMKGVGREGL